MNTLIIEPTSCLDLGGASYELCLPRRDVCENEGTGGIVTGLGEAWCSTCQVDEGYAIPYAAGDEIHIQTQFFDGYNDNPQNPTAGYGDFVTAFITDGDTRIEVTTGMVAYGCKGSFQVLRIDTTNLALDCWVVELNVHNAGGDIRKTLQTQQYARVTTDQCQNTLLLRGAGRGTDCFGNCYEEPDAYTGELIEYNNQIRLWASIKDVGGDFVKEGSTGGYFNTEVTEPYRISLGKKIPPFAKRVLIRQILNAPEVYVDGELYDIDAFKIDNEVRYGRMFLFGIDLERKCNSNKC